MLAAQCALPVLAAAFVVRGRYRIGDTVFSRVADFVETSAMAGAFSLLGVVGTYLLAMFGTPYTDDLLARIDSWTGFDWPAAYRLTHGSPLIQFVGRVSYEAIFLAPLLILGGLCASGRAAMARRFVLAHGLSLVITLVVYAFFPAKGPILYFGFGDASYVPINTGAHAAVIDALRDGSLSSIGARKLEGMVSFPSFHATSVILFMWAARPVRWLRWSIWPVATLMMLSTPVEGNHYLIDLVGGVAVAWPAIKLATFLSRSRKAKVQVPVTDVESHVEVERERLPDEELLVA